MKHRKMVLLGILAICFSNAMAQNSDTTAAKVEAADAALAADKAAATAEVKKTREAWEAAIAKEKAASKAAGQSVTLTAKAASGADGSLGVFSNLNAGIAVFHLGSDEIVDATIENHIVRVKEKRRVRAGPWLQTTWVKDSPGGCSRKWIKCGIFLGAELGGDNLVKSVGTGVVLQFRRVDENGEQTTKGAINLGIGLHWTSVQLLGAGLVENEPIGEGIESIRYRNETRRGVVINVSFAF
jgi:hypothetical protein